MTPAQLASYVRLKTRTNSTTFTDSDLLVLANAVKERLILKTIDANEDYFLVPTYLNLVASSTSREYPMHEDMLSKLKRVEAKLDGTNWVKLSEFDLTEWPYPVSTEADITAYFGNEEGKAFFDIMRNSLWIYSGTITAVTAGLRVWVTTVVPDILSLVSTTDMSVDPSTTTHGIPRALHQVLADGVVIEWKQSRENPIPLNQIELTHEYRIKEAIQSLKGMNYDRQIIGNIPYDDGSDY